MAGASPLRSYSTDCPVCKSLCLGPTILPCGHLLCRKCLRGALQAKGENPTCLVCSYRLPSVQGQTVVELVDSLQKDLIIDDLVTQQLANQDPLFCLACPNKPATKVCLDCWDMYCCACSSAHKRMTCSKDHMQQDLPSTLLNAPSAAQSFPTPSDDIISSSAPDVSIRHSHDSRPPPNTDKERLKMEARLCEEGVSRLKDAVAVVDKNIAQLQLVKKKLEDQQQLLTSYARRLARPDDVLLSKTVAMLPRLRRVREDCCPPPRIALTGLTEHVNTLLTSATSGAADTLPDPMTSEPRKTYVMKPESAGDTHKHGPFVTSIVATEDGRLVMLDTLNCTVKVADLNDPVNTLLGVKLDTADKPVRPRRHDILKDRQVAVTTSERRIYFVDISGHPTVVSHVQTARQCIGVASGQEDDTLVVSCQKDQDGPASVDVITQAGEVLRTVADSNTLTDLKEPEDLCVTDGQVLVSDLKAHSVFQVMLATGDVVRKLTVPELRYPLQVATDHVGNCYIASGNGDRVLVVTPGGQWRELLHGPEHGDGPRVKPWGVCVTTSGLVVTWYRPGGHSVVVGYDLV